MAMAPSRPWLTGVVRYLTRQDRRWPRYKLISGDLLHASARGRGTAGHQSGGAVRAVRGEVTGGSGGLRVFQSIVVSTPRVSVSGPTSDFVLYELPSIRRRIGFAIAAVSSAIPNAMPSIATPHRPSGKSWIVSRLGWPVRSDGGAGAATEFRAPIIMACSA